MKAAGRYASILRLGFPILVSQLGMIATGFADTFMVGQYSTEALASASFVNNIFNTAILACIGFTYGMTPLVGRLFSQDKQHEIGTLVHSGVIINTLFAIVVTAVMTVIYFFLHRLGQPTELLPIIRPYYITYIAGIIPITIFNVFAQWSYAINRTKMPMWIMLATNVVNVVLNWVFIYGNLGAPELGLTGAGIATLLARVIAPVSIIAVFFCKTEFSGYRKGFVEYVRSKGRMMRVASISWPISLQMALETGSFTAAAIMAGWLGAIELASFQLMVIIGTLGFSIYYSMAAAVSVLVSNAAGRNDTTEMRRTAFAGYRILLVLAGISSLLFIFFGRPLINIFTDDPRVITMSVSLILPLVLYQLGDATQINFANALRGTSHVKVMSWIAFISYVVVGLPATWILAFPAHLGIYGIILSFSVSLFTAGALFLYFFLHYTPRRPKTTFSA